MDFFQANLTEGLLVLGLLLLVIEIAVLGFSTFVLFFVGLACVSTAVLVFIGILPDSVMYSLIAIAVLTAIYAGILWQPLKRMQSKTEAHKADNDMIGMEFVLASDASNDGSATYRYSGIEWKLATATDLAKGQKVRVTHIEVGVMHIEAA